MNFDDNINSFIQHNKTILIAPAGYGKTYSIASCLNSLQQLNTKFLSRVGVSNKNIEHKKQLILTHSHAGIASIKKKLREQNVNPKSYDIMTIHSLACKLCKAFDPDLIEENYDRCITEATSLINRSNIYDVIFYSYEGIFVDEYQDCTDIQHEFIKGLSDHTGVKIYNIKTRIFGDPLQGIFDFKNHNLVNLDDLNEFSINKYDLKIPWRWKFANRKLGEEDLVKLRDQLLKSENVCINWQDFNNIIFHLYKPCKNSKITEQTLFPDGGNNGKYSPINNSILECLILKEIKKAPGSCLIISPDSSNSINRMKLLRSLQPHFPNIDFLESDLDCINKAKQFDDLLTKIISSDMKINKTGNQENIKKLFTLEHNNQSNSIINISDLIKQSYTKDVVLDSIQKILEIFEIVKIKEIKIKRKRLFDYLCEALTIALQKNITVSEATRLIVHHNKVNMRDDQKYIGTTLLTKGLEFNTVIIINPESFKCSKNLYVALTRASEKLVILSTKKCWISQKLQKNLPNTQQQELFI